MNFTWPLILTRLQLALRSTCELPSGHECFDIPLCSPSRLSQDARRIVSTDPNVSVSIVSFWEIAIKQGLGKLNINSTIPQIERICLMRNIKILPILPVEIEDIKALSLIHKDPFDKILICQAKTENMRLMTHDSLLPFYNEPCILCV